MVACWVASKAALRVDWLVSLKVDHSVELKDDMKVDLLAEEMVAMTVAL
jgi:hypothetical protein